MHARFLFVIGCCCVHRLRTWNILCDGGRANLRHVLGRLVLGGERWNHLQSMQLWDICCRIRFNFMHGLLSRQV